jgi:hypothetical protein
MHRSEHQRPNGEATLVASGERYRANSLIHKLWQQARVLETGMHASSAHMGSPQAFNRRCLLLSRISFGLPLASADGEQGHKLELQREFDSDIQALDQMHRLQFVQEQSSHMNLGVCSGRTSSKEKTRRRPDEAPDEAMVI